MSPPTNLPSWRDVNRIVVRALAAGAADVLTADEAEQAVALILERHAREKLPPEYQAQVLAETLYGRYFELLRHLDSDHPNATHLAAAWLARLGCVRAIVTTNFDRLIETAFAALDTPLETHFRPGDFDALAQDLDRFDLPDGPCRLLKLHGSVDDPKTLIDTLAQRKKGFPPAVTNCMRHLLRTRHWLFLGFSGLDLEADEGYLELAPQAQYAEGFTWLVRTGTEAVPAVKRLGERYADRGELLSGNLPEWLLGFADQISPEPRSWIEQRASEPVEADPVASISALEAAARDWAAGLTPTMCAFSLARLVTVCAEPQAAVRLVERILGHIDAHERNAASSSEDFAPIKSLIANSLGNLLTGLGRYEEAVHWIGVAIELAEAAGDEDTHDRWLGNLAVNLEMLGRIEEATRAYQTALAGYRERADPIMIASGLTGLASHFIRQGRLDEARTLAQEAVAHATKAGDERMRGTALNDLGMIAKLKEDYAAALAIFEDVERLFTRLGNDEAVAAAAGNRGEVLAAQGRFDEAEAIQHAVLAVNERLEHRDHQAATSLALAVLNQRKGDAAAAEHWFERARVLYRELKDPSNEALALRRLAALMNETGRFDDALDRAQAALPLVDGRNAAFTADVLAQIGAANLKLGYPVRAADAYRRAIPLFEQLKARSAIAASAMNLGTALLLLRANDQAESAFVRAADLWKELQSQENFDYCRLGEATARLDTRLGELSDAGHAAPEPDQQRAAAREMVALYPQLIANYQQIGAAQLAAECCASAGSTAEFAGDWMKAVDWYRQGAMLFGSLGLQAQAAKALGRCESLLQGWANQLLRKQEVVDAVAVLVPLADVSGQLGHRARRATALLNAAICELATERFREARDFAKQALSLSPAGSEDAMTAHRVIEKCDGQLGAG